jgi:hypothetical protein
MDVERWLSEIGMEEHYPSFKQNAIETRSTLVSLTEDDLESIGIATLGHRKVIMASIRKLKDEGWTPRWSTKYWLKEIGQQQYTSAFIDNAITTRQLVMTLTEDDLRSIGVTALGHRKAIVRAIEALKSSGQTPAAPQPVTTSEAPKPAASNTVVEVHQSHVGTDLWYHVGEVNLSGKSVSWGASQKYDRGRVPTCDFDGTTVVEVHQGHDDNKLWYRLGTVNKAARTISWTSGSNYDRGRSPVVAFSGNTVVEIHQSHADSDLWYHVGILDRAGMSINWGPSYKFDRGRIPSVAFAGDAQTVVEVHQAHESAALWYHVGVVNPAARTIDWGRSHRYDQGRLPMCDTAGNTVVEVHQGHDDVQLWYRIGTLGAGSRTIGWSGSKKYDRGKSPTVAVNGNAVVEMHQSHSGTRLWYHVGVLDTASGQITWGPSYDFDEGRIPSIGF